MYFLTPYIITEKEGYNYSNFEISYGNAEINVAVNETSGFGDDETHVQRVYTVTITGFTSDFTIVISIII